MVNISGCAVLPGSNRTGLKPCICSAELGPGLMEGKKEVLNMFTMQIVMVTNKRHIKGINRITKSTCWIWFFAFNVELLFTLCFCKTVKPHLICSNFTFDKLKLWIKYFCIKVLFGVTKSEIYEISQLDLIIFYLSSACWCYC